MYWHATLLVVALVLVLALVIVFHLIRLQYSPSEEIKLVQMEFFRVLGTAILVVD
jgi:hypothetical protein